jgi:hypothetical protein
MNFIWSDSPTHYRCTTDKPVPIKTLDWGNSEYKHTLVQNMGYVLLRDGRLLACVYGSVHPDSPGAWFDHIDDAKRYVEEQALVGLTLNRLTR